MEAKLKALYGLKFNPFTQDIPTAALYRPPAIEQFCWRIQQQVPQGGFAMVCGDPGTGKSATLRILAETLGDMRDVCVRLLSRPQASTSDFYRELGDIFGVTLSPINRWAGTKQLRQRWIQHIETSLLRPVLLVDEAQEMKPAVLSELRLLAATELDSQSLLTVVLAGDSRLTDHLDTPQLLPVASRIRTRLRTEYLQPQQLAQCLAHLLKEAGNPKLLTPQLAATLCEHAAGNYRTMTNMANELLALAMHKESDLLDEALFFDAFSIEPQTLKRKRA